MATVSLKLGFIGLGIMGAPMAGHLIKAGHQLFVHTRGKLKPEIAESGALESPSFRARFLPDEARQRDWSEWSRTSTGRFRSSVVWSRFMVSAAETSSNPAKVTKCWAGGEFSMPTPPAPAPGAT